MKILYEDSDILVVFKEAGLAVESRRATEPDLESLLLRYLSEKRESGSKPENAGKPGNGSNSENRGKPELHIVHRLDQPVAGILVFAKTKAAAAGLAKQLTDGRMKKLYRASVDGPIPKEEDTLSDYLVKDGRTNMSRVDKNGKKAVLHYRKLTEDTLEIELFTGRHHQMRVQLAHAGMPIRGDVKYGAASAAGKIYQESKSAGKGQPESKSAVREQPENKSAVREQPESKSAVREQPENKSAGNKVAERAAGIPERGIALTAYRLSFCHPRTKKKMTFCAEDAAGALPS